MRSADPDRVMTAARAWIGTPYHPQASRLGVGCDCLGLLRGVWRDLVGSELPVLPAYSSDWGEVRAQEVLRDGCAAHMIAAEDDAQPGDVVLFRMRSWAIAKHAGILVAPDQMVHSHSVHGVIAQAITAAWWARAAFVFRFPDGGDI
jgi:NlpC/P60 family putative phage cell wall peptidase